MDKGVTKRLYGNYRAKVVENKDKEKFGRVMVWIPDLMPMVSDKKGIWARPANNPIGGRNKEDDQENYYTGTCYIPRKGSWIWIFFEAGNINKPYYFAALDIENTKVLPENQLGTNFEDKWTIFRSNQGRVIIVSDDPDDERVEITGQKSQRENPKVIPSGNTESVYQIDGNQTTILFDERTKKEKILIRTWKGDFLHIDIDERQLQAYFKNDISIKSDKNIYVTAKEKIHIVSQTDEIRVKAKEDINVVSDIGSIYVTARTESIDLLAAKNIHLTSADDFNILSGANLNYQASNEINGLAGSDMNLDAGGNLNEQMGAAGPAAPANSALDANEADPRGERET